MHHEAVTPKNILLDDNLNVKMYVPTQLTG